jgi:hypothetical protein
MLREKHRSRIFENMGPEEDIWTHEGRGNRRMEKTAIRGTLRFLGHNLHEILFGLSNQEE